jgi:two-component system, OmpR family, phosphate regulon response regulator PhoB
LEQSRSPDWLVEEGLALVGVELLLLPRLYKPFGIRELVARCRALLRYAQGANPQDTKQILHHKEIILDLQAYQARRKGEAISLSRKEFLLLELFMTHPKRVWSREQLIDRVWGEDFLGIPKKVDVHIRWLREKLEDNPSNPQLLITIRGFGYRLS